MGLEDGFNNFAKRVPLNSSQGAATSVYASFDPELAQHNGKYLLRCGLADPFTEIVRPWATDSTEAERLWRLSEDIVGQKFSY